MYLVESKALAAAATAAVSKQVNGNAPDGKFEDYVAAGVRMADLVAAGSRAASNVAGAILFLHGTAGGVQYGHSPEGGACKANGGGASCPAGPASLVHYLAYGAGCDGSSTTAGGRGGGGGFAAAGAGGEEEGAACCKVDEKLVTQPAYWKPKRGRPKKQEAGDAAGSV